MTIILFVENSGKYAQLSLQTLLRYTEDPIIVVDNGVDDTMRKWANENPGNYSYAYNDEGPVHPGLILNDVLESFGVEDDIMILDSHIAITPNSYMLMKEILESRDQIGAVGPLCNSFSYNQYLPLVKDYSMCLECDNNREQKEAWTLRALGLFSEAIMISKEARSKIGKFDEELQMIRDVIMNDFCIRLDINGYECLSLCEAYFWDMRGVDYTVPTSYEIGALSKKWGMKYFNLFGNGTLVDAISEPEEKEMNVLEIGCDLGATLIQVKNAHPNAHIYGADINESAIRIAKGFMDARVCNVEDKNLDYGDTKFDYIICGDVLEHLRDPAGTVSYCKSLLAKNGKIIASIPNVMHISVMKNLLDGNFTYTDIGLLDRTHIHLFTYNEIVRMFSENGYEIVKMAWNQHENVSDEDNALIDSLVALSDKSERWMYEAFQYLVIAQKK